jgi:hypothetical protein
VVGKRSKIVFSIPIRFELMSYCAVKN